jgi:hypothetical protein
LTAHAVPRGIRQGLGLTVWFYQNEQRLPKFRFSPLVFDPAVTGFLVRLF